MDAAFEGGRPRDAFDSTFPQGWAAVGLEDSADAHCLRPLLSKSGAKLRQPIAGSRAGGPGACLGPAGSSRRAFRDCVAALTGALAHFLAHITAYPESPGLALEDSGRRDGECGGKQHGSQANHFPSSESLAYSGWTPGRLIWFEWSLFSWPGRQINLGR